MQELLFYHWMRFRLLCHQPDRTCPDTLCSQRQSSGHLPAAGYPTRGHYWRRCHRIHNLRSQYHAGNLACMATRLEALRDDEIDTSLFLMYRVLDCTNQGSTRTPFWWASSMI